MGFVTTLNVQVEGQTLELTGGDFWAMKEFVADRDRFPGREYKGDLRLWVVPDVSLNEFKSLVEAQSWSLLMNEDEAIEAELGAIQSIQNWVRWHSEEIAYRAELAAEKAGEYSYRSKSREKASAMTASGCFHHALKYAKVPIEELSEPQIATLKSALKRVNEQGTVALQEWLIRFMIDDSSKLDDETFAQHVLPASTVSFRNVPKRGDDYLLDLYQVEVAKELGCDSAFLPSARIEERYNPDSVLESVVTFQVKE